MNIKKSLKITLLKIKNRKKKININRSSNVSIDTMFGGNNYIGLNTTFQGIIGFGSYIGDNCSINAIIGRFCSIADNVHFINGKHPINDNIATSPLFYSIRNKNLYSFAKKNHFDEFSDKSVIGDNVWIGYGSIILNGAKIGEGAVIAAGSVVTTDVAPYSIVGGVPAKVIRYRFNENQIKQIEGMNLWNHDTHFYEKYYDLFLDVSNLELINTLSQKKL